MIPENNDWVPTYYEDLAGENKVQKVADLHTYLDGVAIRTREDFRSRWFAPTTVLPCRGDNVKDKGPRAPGALCMEPPLCHQEKNSGVNTVWRNPPNAMPKMTCISALLPIS